MMKLEQWRNTRVTRRPIILPCWCALMFVLAATPAYAITTGEGDSPQEMQRRNDARRIVFPPLNGDPRESAIRTQQIKAMIEARQGQRQQAQERLKALEEKTGESPRQEAQALEAQAQETQTQQAATQQTLEQQAATEAEQAKALKDYHKQQMQQYLFNAIQKGHLNWIMYALKNGADPVTAFGGYTPVQYAVFVHKLDAAKYLIDQGGPIGTRENAYFMLFHMAAYEGNGALIDTLLVRGADPRVEDSSGKQAWEYARTPAMREKLMTSGGRVDAAPGAASSAPEPAPENQIPGEDTLFPDSPQGSGAAGDAPAAPAAPAAITVKKQPAPANADDGNEGDANTGKPEDAR